jgi:precorrin-8X/cobalt-precorrin-8 methylmutase
MFDYLMDPIAIEQDSFYQIRQLTQLQHFDRDAQQVIMRVIHSLGDPDVAAHMRISSHACIQGRAALGDHGTILCDTEMVKQGITKRMTSTAPLCYINHPHTTQLAIQRGETRSMAALQKWQSQLENSIVVIGNAPTALFRLLEMMHQGCAIPALIVGMPVGFVGAAEAKQALWDQHQTLGTACITLLGRQGGSAAAAAVINALLRCNNDEYY